MINNNDDYERRPVVMAFKDILKVGASFFYDVVSEASKDYEKSQMASTKKRSTDLDYEKNRKGMSSRPEDFDVRRNVPLSQASSSAPGEPGVYILYLNGQVMKCGRAAYAKGIRWRMQQYYSLKYDGRAQHGDCWAVDENNRDRVMVSWQCCPVAVCKELEYKLFQKYGKGLNPYFGVMHKDRENHPTLASDLMEEWRAVLIDSTALSMLNGHELCKEDFYTSIEQPGVFLEKEGFRKYMQKLEGKFRTENRYIPYIDYSVTFRQALDLQIGQFVKAIETGNPEEYTPIIIR